MSGIPRLNGVIKALEQGHTAFVSFCPVDIESVVAMAGSHLDGGAFEMEHPPRFSRFTPGPAVDARPASDPSNKHR